MEVRALPEGASTMEVRFSRFGAWYEIDSMWEGTFLERTMPGAFKRTINNNGHQVRVLFNHGMDPQIGDKVLGKITSLTEESDSPVGEVDLFDTSYNRDLLPGLQAGVYGSSFRMRVIHDEWNDDPGISTHNPKGVPERTIREVRLFEFGPVTFPANPESTASVRSLTDDYYDQLRARDPGRVDELRAKAAAIRGITTPLDLDGTSRAVVHEDAADIVEPAVTPDPAARHSGTTPPASPIEGDKPERTTMSTMTIEERAARQSEIRARLAEIDAEFTGAALSEETRTEWDSLNVEHDEHEQAIADSVERRSRIAKLAGTPANVERGTDSTRSLPGARRAANIFDLAEIRQMARSTDDLPGLYRDHAMRAVEAARFGRDVNREDAQANIDRLLHTIDDEHGTLARSILTTGSPTYTRAFGKMAQRLGTTGLTAEELRALSLGTNSAGGFAVPFQLDPTIILTNSGSVNPLRQISRVEQIVGKEWDGITSAGITVSRAAEAAEASDNAPTLAQPTVKAERVQGFVPFSIELEQDWNSLLTEMTSLLADAKDNEEATSFVTGTGVSPEANGIVTTLAVGSNVTANTLNVAALYSLEEALPDRFLANASILAHRSVYNVIRQFDTAGGANLWERLPNGLPNELLGYPAYRSSAMTDATLAINDRYLLMGDFRQFLIVDRVGMMVDVVPHLLGANRRPTGQRGLYAIWRNNSKILTDAAFRILFKAA